VPSSIGDVDYDELESIFAEVESGIGSARSMVDVAAHVTTALYDRFAPSVALVRLFATVPYMRLPDAERVFAEAIAAQSTETLQPDTPVLVLLGTRGDEPEWNDRTKSSGHLAIPLISQAFVDEIPMLARLLTSIGFEADWGGTGRGFVTKSIANLNGVFFVDDARTALDERGRNIIPAASFVERYKIRSVFGIGGSYVSRHAYLAAMLFTRESMMRSNAMTFVPLIGSLKASTTRLINREQFF
jgi:hypothetical protein